MSLRQVSGLQDQEDGKQKAIMAPPLGLTISENISEYGRITFVAYGSIDEDRKFLTITAVLWALRRFPALVGARPAG